MPKKIAIIFVNTLFFIKTLPSKVFYSQASKTVSGIHRHHAPISLLLVRKSENMLIDAKKRLLTN